MISTWIKQFKQTRPMRKVLFANLLKVSKPMITAHLTSVMSKGYITKQPSLEDKRAYYI